MLRLTEIFVQLSPDIRKLVARMANMHGSRASRALQPCPIFRFKFSSTCIIGGSVPSFKHSNLCKSRSSVFFPEHHFYVHWTMPPRSISANLEISEADSHRFTILRNRKQHIMSAIKELNGRKKALATDDEDG